MAETKKTVVARLFAEHGGALQAFLSRRVRRQPDAAELAQEVYVRMLRVPDLAAIRDPGAYLYTVASNLVRDHARRQRPDRMVLDSDDPLVQEELSELPGFAAQLDAEQRVKRLTEVLHQLPPKCRAAVVLQSAPAYAARPWLPPATTSALVFSRELRALPQPQWRMPDN